MLFGLASHKRTNSDARLTELSEAPFYPGDLLPALQNTLAVLADLDIRHEIDRDAVEGWSGPDEVKQLLRAELEAEWQRAREPIVLRWTELQSQWGATSCATEVSARSPCCSVPRVHGTRDEGGVLGTTAIGRPSVRRARARHR